MEFMGTILAIKMKPESNRKKFEVLSTTDRLTELTEGKLVKVLSSNDKALSNAKLVGKKIVLTQGTFNDYLFMIECEDDDYEVTVIVAPIISTNPKYGYNNILYWKLASYDSYNNLMIQYITTPSLERYLANGAKYLHRSLLTESYLKRIPSISLEESLELAKQKFIEDGSKTIVYGLRGGIDISSGAMDISQIKNIG